MPSSSSDTAAPAWLSVAFRGCISLPLGLARDVLTFGDPVVTLFPNSLCNVPGMLGNPMLSGRKKKKLFLYLL